MFEIMLAKWLISFAAAVIMIGPMFADFNATHATNPLWTPHARFHVVWQVLSNSSISLVALWLIWLSPWGGATPLFLAAILNYIWIAGFFATMASMRLYEGALKDVNGIKPFRFNIFGVIYLVDTNLFGACVLTLVNSAAVILLLTA